MRGVHRLSLGMAALGAVLALLLGTTELKAEFTFKVEDVAITRPESGTAIGYIEIYVICSATDSLEISGFQTSVQIDTDSSNLVGFDVSTIDPSATVSHTPVLPGGAFWYDRFPTGDSQLTRVSAEQGSKGATGTIQNGMGLVRIPYQISAGTPLGVYDVLIYEDGYLDVFELADATGFDAVDLGTLNTSGTLFAAGSIHVVPEPSTLVLLMTGGIAAFALLRRGMSGTRRRG